MINNIFSFLLLKDVFILKGVFLNKLVFIKMIIKLYIEVESGQMDFIYLFYNFNG